jgi:hypothetical protein
MQCFPNRTGGVKASKKSRTHSEHEFASPVVAWTIGSLTALNQLQMLLTIVCNLFKENYMLGSR